MEASNQVQREATVKKQEISFNENVVGLISEDIKDCMLGSNDLSKQQLPIAREIHNTEITRDHSEAEGTTQISVEKVIMVPNHHGNTATPDLCNIPSKTYGSVMPETTHTTADGITCAVLKDEPIRDVCSPRTDVAFIREEAETNFSTVSPVHLDVINAVTVQQSVFDAMTSSFCTDETAIKDEPTTHGSTPIIRAPSPGVTVDETNVLPLATDESENLPHLQIVSNSDFIMAPIKVTSSWEATRDTESLQARGVLSSPATSSLSILSTSLTADVKAPALHRDLTMPSASVLTNNNSESLLAAGSLPATKHLDTFFLCAGQEPILIQSDGNSSVIHSKPASSHDMNVDLPVNDCTSTNHEGLNTGPKTKMTVPCVVCYKQFESHHELACHYEFHHAHVLFKTDDSHSIKVANCAGESVIGAGNSHMCVMCGKSIGKRSYLRKHLKRNSCHFQPSVKREQHTAKQCLNAPAPGLNSKTKTLKLTAQNMSSSLHEVDSLNSQFGDSDEKSLPISQTHKTTDLCLGQKADKVSVTKNRNETAKHPPSKGLNLEVNQQCTLCMKKMTGADLEKHTENVKSGKYSHILHCRDVKNECSFCREMFPSKCELIEHFRQTPQCDKNFEAIPVTETPKYVQATTSSNTSEPASVNPARFNHPCDNSDAVFIDTKKLKAHQEHCKHRTNKSDSPDMYKCLVCGRAFQTLSERTDHVCAAYEEESGFGDIQTVAIKRHFEASELSKHTSRSISHSSVFVTNPSSVVASSSDQTAVTLSSKAGEISYRTSGTKEVSATDSSVFISATTQPCLSISSNPYATSSSLHVVRCDTCSVWFTSYALLQRHFQQHPSCKKVTNKETVPDRENNKTDSELGTSLMKGLNIYCYKCQRRFATNSMLDRHFSDSPKCKAKAGEDRQVCGTEKNVNSEGGRQDCCSENLVQDRTNSTDAEKCLQRASSDVTEIVHSQENHDGSNIYNQKETEAHEVKVKKNTSHLGGSSSPFKRNKRKRSSEGDFLSKDFILKKPKIILDTVSVMCKLCKSGLKDDVALVAHLKQSKSCSNGYDNSSVTTGFPCVSSVCNKAFTSEELGQQHLQGSKDFQRNLDGDVCEKNIQKENLKATPVSCETTPVDKARMSLIEEYMEGKDSVVSDLDDSSDSDSSSTSGSSSLESDENVSDAEFKCKVCDKRFHRVHFLSKHMKEHDEEHQPQLVKKNKTRCRVCTRRLEDSTALQAHLIQHRFCFIAQAQKQWRKEYAQSKCCGACGKMFSSPKILRRHCCKNMTCRLRYINSILEGCKKKNRKNKVRSKFLSDETNESEAVKRENTVRTMDIPDSQVSDKQNPGLCCKNCVKTFKNKTEFSLHFRNNDGCLNFYNDGAQECPVEIYNCSRCERYFNTLHHKNQHVCASLRKKVFICPLCSHRFVSRSALGVHLYRKHKKKMVDISGDKLMKGNAKSLCTEANFNAEKTKEFDKNLGNDTAPEINAQLNPYSTFAEKMDQSCVECGLTFSQCDQFVSHVATHERVAPKINEKSHKNSEGAKKEIYSCFICKEAFDELKKLKVHYEKSKCGSYECNFCSVQFESLAALNKHQCQDGRRIQNKTDSPETKPSHLQIHVRLPEAASDSAKTVLSFKKIENLGNPRVSKITIPGSCKLCHKKITGTTDFHEHIENSHPKRKMTNYMQFFKPNKDISPFARKENLNEPLSKHVGTCRVCHKKFETTEAFCNHVKTSHAKRSLVNYMRLFKPSGDMSSPLSSNVLSPLTMKQDVQKADNFKHQRSLIEVVGKKEVTKLSSEAERPEQEAINSGQGKGQKQFFQEQTSVDSHLHQDKKLCTICKKMLLRTSFGNHFKYHLRNILQHFRNKPSKPLVSFSKEKCPICGKLLTRKSLKVHLLRHRSKDIIAQSPTGPSISSSLVITQIKSEKDWKKPIVKSGCESSSESERKDSENYVMADVAVAKSLNSSNTECPVCKRLFSSAASMIFHARQSHPIEYLKRKSMFCSKKTERAGNAKKVSTSTISRSCSAEYLKKTEDVLSSSPSFSSSVCAGKSFSGSNVFLGKAAKRQYIGVCSICKKEIVNFPSFKFHLKIQHNIENDKCEQFLAKPDNSCAIMESADEDIKIPKTKGQISKKSVHVKKKSKQNLRDPSGSKSRKHKYTSCHLCEKRLKMNHYVEHLTAVHRLAESSVFSCHFCFAKFPYQQLADEHSVLCEKECVCMICSKQFMSLKAVKNHMCSFHKILYSNYVSRPKEEVTKRMPKLKKPGNPFQCVIEMDNGGLVIRNHNDMLLEDLTSDPPNECQELQTEDSLTSTRHVLTTFQQCEEIVLDKRIKSEDEEG